MNLEDYKYLSLVYIELISDEQVKELYGIIDMIHSIHIEGMMSIGSSFYYNYEKLFRDYQDLKNVDDKVLVLHYVTVIFCKYCLEHYTDWRKYND